MPKKIKIAGFTVGHGCKPFLIAEAGINHNGDLKKAFAMIRVARRAGVDAIKFQTFKAEEFVSDPSQTYTYRSQGKRVTESMLEMFRRYEFSDPQWRAIKKRCAREKILFLSTPQNISDLRLLLSLGVPAVKVGSDDFVNIPLLKEYAKTRLPLILSSGMSDLREVRAALTAVGARNGYPVVLLVCTSLYPTRPNEVNLRRIETLRRLFPGLLIGFSDHTQGALASSLAVSLGACVVEKHFTLSHDLPGPDHWFSEDVSGLGKWVESVRTAFQMMGRPQINPTPEERKNKKSFQRVIVAAKDIPKNETFSERNLVMMRTGKGRGLSPLFYERLLGKRAKRSFEKGEIVSL